LFHIDDSWEKFNIPNLVYVGLNIWWGSKMRKGKIVSIMVCMLVCLSSVLIVPNEIKVKASGAGGGEGDDTGLDYDFVWNVTKLLCNVTQLAYMDEPFSRGRGWATAGETYTIDNILIKYMNGTVIDDYCNLTGVTTLPLGHLDDFDDHYYTSKVEAIDFNLNVNNVSYPFENPMPKTEIFPWCAGAVSYENTSCVKWNYSFTNAEIIKPLLSLFPLSGTLHEYYYTIPNDPANSYKNIVGNATYVASVEDLPEDLVGRIFVTDEEAGCEDVLDNITESNGAILIQNESRNYTISDAEKYNFSLTRIGDTDGNFTEIKVLLESGEAMIVDNAADLDILTFAYNLSQACLPSEDYVVIIGVPADSEDIWTWFSLQIEWRTWGYWLLNRLTNQGNCTGFILYDYNNDTHLMGSTIRDWSYRYGVRAFPALPLFSINGTVGRWLENNRSGTTVSGFLNQTFYNEGIGEGVKSNNVVGYRNISKSPNDSIVIISSRFDGWWGPTPGDSGVGNAIILGIAKYFNDYNITPKYNLTFLFTTGEEYGKRGAYHYRDSHPDENFSLWIGTDQLAWDQNDSFLEPQISDQKSDKTNYSIVWQIVNDTNYNQTGYNCIPNFLEEDESSGAEDDVWMKRCTTICFGKDTTSELTRYHRAGMNYTEGDVLKYIDRNDTNVTFEVVWNVIKYFTVDPNCWFDSYSETGLDSAGDGDYLNDSIKATFTVKSILPHDLVMINATLKNAANDTVNQTFMNFTVNSTGRQESVTLTIPEDEPPGNYTLYLELYNSTGRINEIVEIGDNNYNDTTPSPSYFIDMYPYNFDKFPSEITNVSATPSPVGFGFNVTISANVTDNASYVNNVSVNITYPNNNTGNFTMTNTEGDTYEYVFSDTWLVGQYNYTIWTLDNSSNSNSSSGHSYNVSVNATISVCTIKDEYGNNETVNLTDPPSIDPPSIGYELLDDVDVLHMWNEYNSYYFNTSSGIQLTNHYGEYWSHNVMMLGYYNNDEWNLIYRTDELSGFNKNIESDNETYVNATLWKDLTYQGYDFRLAIRYHLGVNDSDLTVIPYIKNLGQAIPYTLAFGWEIKDIKIADTDENDWIRLYNGTDWISYRLNQTLDNTYTDMDYNTTFYLEGRNEGKYFRRTLYLGWNHTLDYLVQVKSRTGQYNAPVTLFIKVGTLAQNQEKYTEMHWLDSDDWLGISSSEHDSCCGNCVGEGPTLENALDGTFYWQHDETETHWFILDLGQTYTIKKVRGRSLTLEDPTSVNIYVSDSKTSWGTAVATGINTWQDIPIWQEVDTTDKNGRYVKVEIETTEETRNSYIQFGGEPPGYFTIFDVYGDIVNQTPVVSDPYPANGSTGVSTSPMLNITVSDPNGDSMNITWFSNSSGSWQVFGTNNSVGNGTYHQTFANASVNAQWWYWKVNVSDGTNYAESSVYKFYTGCQSKIVNTGSTNIKGYLLIQVQYYNTTSSTWVIADDTINETSPRTIYQDDPFGPENNLPLDTIFNGLVNTSNLSSYGNGTYRIYAAFRDLNGNILKCDDDTELVATYEFTITFD